MAETYAKEADGDVVVVFGGDGFLGRYIVESLLKSPQVAHVRVFDRQQRYSDVPYVIGDVTDPAAVLAALVPQRQPAATAVIHTIAAVPGAPGAVHQRVSVDGTRNVVAVCLAAGSAVKKLVYTSSSSVVYSGRDIWNGTEDMPYAERHVDDYTKFKAAAEKMVLDANGQNGLLTCALRPCGMFGPRDALATTKMIQAAETGRHRVQIGSNKNMVDFTYIENIAYAHLLALHRLGPNSPVSGEAFNITNGEPLAFWDFPRALWAECGFFDDAADDSDSDNKRSRRRTPHRPYVMPYWLAFWLAGLMELIAWLLSPVVAVPVSLSRFHVKFIRVNRVFSIRKARDLLGYEPPVPLAEALRRTGEWYKSTRQPAQPKEE